MTKIPLTARALLCCLLAGCPSGGGGGANRGSGGSELSGTYEASDQDGAMTIEFLSGGKVHETIRFTGGQSDQADGDYMVDGNKITIQMGGGMPLMLVRNGNMLEGNVMGEIMHFSRK